MKTDLYTKSVLTVIAICLLSVALRDTPLISTAHAQAAAGDPTPVNIVQVAGKKVNPDFGGLYLPVKVQN